MDPENSPGPSPGPPTCATSLPSGVQMVALKSVGSVTSRRVSPMARTEMAMPKAAGPVPVAPSPIRNSGRVVQGSPKSCCCAVRQGGGDVERQGHRQDCEAEDGCPAASGNPVARRVPAGAGFDSPRYSHVHEGLPPLLRGTLTGEATSALVLAHVAPPLSETRTGIHDSEASASLRPQASRTWPSSRWTS